MNTVSRLIFIHPRSIDLGISNIVARKNFVFWLDSQQWYQSQLYINVSVRVDASQDAGVEFMVITLERLYL